MNTVFRYFCSLLHLYDDASARLIYQPGGFADAFC